jgi:hypothetical protein
MIPKRRSRRDQGHHHAVYFRLTLRDDLDNLPAFGIRGLIAAMFVMVMHQRKGRPE